MSDDDNSVGYCKPPKHTRWKKGQCGNPKRKRSMKIPSISGLIEAELAKLVTVKEKGIRRQRTVFETILLQLLPLTARGNRRAIRVHGKYQAYAQARPTIIYEPADEHEGDANEYFQLISHLQPTTRLEAELDEAFSKLTPIEAAEYYHELIHRDSNDGK